MTNHPFMNSVGAKEGKKRLLEKYGRREIHLVNNNQTLRGIEALNKRFNLLKRPVMELRVVFENLPSVEIDGFKYRIMP